MRGSFPKMLGVEDTNEGQESQWNRYDLGRSAVQIMLINTLYNYRYLPSCLFVSLIINVAYHVAR